MSRIPRLFVAFSVLAIAATACSATSANEQANYVEVNNDNGTVTTVFNPAPSTSGSTQNQAPESDEVAVEVVLAAQPEDREPAAVDQGAQPRVDANGNPNPDAMGGFYEFQILTAIEKFTTLRDEVEAGSAHPADLEGLAPASTIAEVADARAINLDNIENANPEARLEFVTFPSIVDLQVRDTRMAVVSCTERWGLRSSHVWQAVFVDEVFVFTIAGDELHLIEHHVAHDGHRATEGLTCIPGDFAERAINGARRGVAVLDQIDAAPDTVGRIDFSETFSGTALDSMLNTVGAVDPGRRRVSPVETRYSAVGLDPSMGWDFIAVVSLCRFYPEGIYDVDANGVRVRVDPDHGPATSIETLVYVHVEPERASEGGGETFWDFRPGVSEGCWS